VQLSVWHYDGRSAIRHDAILSAGEREFELRVEGREPSWVPWSDLTFRDARGGERIYGHRTISGWQIGLPEPVSEYISRRLPENAHYGGFIDRIGLWPAAGTLLAISAVAVFVVLQIPAVLAPIVPMSWEKKLGDALVGDFGGRFCQGPGSDAALAAMANRLDPNGEPLSIRIANIPMVNAVALPGGNIVIFRGLLQESKSPDELAGVIGHEMGHVRNRDVMEGLLRQLGISVVLGGANTDAAGYLNTIVSSTYSRGAESKADDYAIKLMEQSKISAADTAGFFARLAEGEKQLDKNAKAALGWIASHPLSEERERKFRATVRKDVSYTPVITPAQWRAIVDSCANDPDVEEGDGFLL
jgi:beta-barrel assembly-enhancing protease